MKELCVPAELEQLDPVLAFVSAELEAAECDAEVQTQIMIAVEEIFVNIFSYAYPPKEGMTTIRKQIESTPAIVQIEMLEQGVSYEPPNREDPDNKLSGQDRGIGGL